MKQMYVCEKCGKMSEDYETIVACESHHYVMERPWDSSGLNEQLEKMSEYKEGQEEPNVIHVCFSRSYWNGEEWKEEKRCGKYKLISSYEMPLVIENE